MEKRTGKRANASKNNYNKKKKIMLAIFTLIIVGAAALIAYSIAIKGIVKEWDDKIYPGVTVQEVNIGGMTKEEAKNKLTQTFVTSIENKKLSIK